MAVKAAVVGFSEKYVDQPAGATSEEAPAASPVSEPDFDKDKLDELENVDLIGLVMSGESTDDPESEDEDSLRELNGTSVSHEYPC